MDECKEFLKFETLGLSLCATLEKYSQGRRPIQNKCDKRSKKCFLCFWQISKLTQTKKTFLPFKPLLIMWKKSLTSVSGKIRTIHIGHVHFEIFRKNSELNK